MDLMQLLSPQTVVTDIKAASKEDILSQMVDFLKNQYSDEERSAIKQAVIEREAMGSTAIGRGVALPHVRMAMIKKWSLVIAFSKQGFELGSIDNTKTHIVFLLLQPEDSGMGHLKCFSQISTIFLNPRTMKSLLAADDHDNNIIIQVLKHSLETNKV